MMLVVVFIHAFCFFFFGGQMYSETVFIIIDVAEQVKI